MSMGPIFTVGHSTRTLAELLQVTSAAGVQAIADVRRFPGSRRSPHFSRGALEETLPAAGLVYAWLPALGGRRRRAPDAPPSAWRVEAFAAYADHLRTSDFRAGIEALLALAARKPTAVLCAEASPYRCHRRLIADWLELHGIEVIHLFDERRRAQHLVTPFARRAGDDVVYEADAQLELPLH
jgi:uncharacterized protein (DUF488 family)